MFFRLSFVTLIVAAVALGTPVKRDEAKVRSDLEALYKQLQALDTSVKGFPNEGATLAEVYAIHEEAESVDTSLETTTNDVNGSPDFTDSQADAIIAYLEKYIVPIVQTGTNDLVAKQPAVKAIHTESIAESDLETMKTNVDELGKTIVGKVPASKQSSVEEQFNSIDNALSNAITVYSS
ncbi:hydrophobic surface binding protein A-domain-containing protein [Boletus coccyginus]|nr:hydrophobic surface binding protein A-domain-containing protein [Boletus coccyginus]